MNNGVTRNAASLFIKDLLMKYLFGVTLIWAFSFSLIGEYLSGYVDPWFSVLIHIGVAAMIFLPFLKLKGIKKYSF